MALRRVVRFRSEHTSVEVVGLALAMFASNISFLHCPTHCVLRMIELRESPDSFLLLDTVEERLN